MAEPRAQVEELVRAVTDEVLGRLSAAVARRPARLWLLLARPVGQPAQLASLRAVAREVNLEAVLLAPPGLVGLVPAEAGRALDPAGLERVLSELAPGDALVLLGLGFALGRRLLALDDEDPAVHLVCRVLLRGGPVLAALDDLTPAPPARGRIAEQAVALGRELSALGIELAPADELGGRLRRLRAVGGTAALSLGGLVTEAEVEAVVARGERRVALGRGCLVTPLASSRAAELGLELVRQED